MLLCACCSGVPLILRISLADACGGTDVWGGMPQSTAHQGGGGRGGQKGYNVYTAYVLKTSKYVRIVGFEFLNSQESLELTFSWIIKPM